MAAWPGGWSWPGPLPRDAIAAAPPSGSTAITLVVPAVPIKAGTGPRTLASWDPV